MNRFLILLTLVFSFHVLANENCIDEKSVNAFIVKTDVSRILASPDTNLVAMNTNSKSVLNESPQFGQVLCCCNTYNGGSCCKYVNYCGGFVPGCACQF